MKPTTSACSSLLSFLQICHQTPGRPQFSTQSLEQSTQACIWISLSCTVHYGAGQHHAWDIFLKLNFHKKTFSRFMFEIWELKWKDMCEWVCVWKRETENMLVCVWQKICVCAFCKIIGSLVNFDGNANEYMHFKNMEIHQKSINKGGQISSEIQYLSNMYKALHLRARIMPKWKRRKHHLKLEIPNNLKV